MRGCVGEGGESCFLKFYLPSSSSISAVLCPVFSFTLEGQGTIVPGSLADIVRLPVFCMFGAGCLFCICFLLEVLTSTGQEGSGKEALQRRLHWGLCYPWKFKDIFAIFLLTLICCSLMMEKACDFERRKVGFGFPRTWH